LLLRKIAKNKTKTSHAWDEKKNGRLKLEWHKIKVCLPLYNIYRSLTGLSVEYRENLSRHPLIHVRLANAYN